MAELGPELESDARGHTPCPQDAHTCPHGRHRCSLWERPETRVRRAHPGRLPLTPGPEGHLRACPSLSRSRQHPPGADASLCPPARTLPQLVPHTPPLIPGSKGHPSGSLRVSPEAQTGSLAAPPTSPSRMFQDVSLGLFIICPFSDSFSPRTLSLNDTFLSYCVTIFNILHKPVFQILLSALKAERAILRFILPLARNRDSLTTGRTLNI